VGCERGRATEPSSARTIRLAGNVVGPYTPFEEATGFEVAAYGLVHATATATATVRVPRDLAVLGVRNLLDRAYPELRAGGFVAPGQPRSVHASLQYSF